MFRNIIIAIAAIMVSGCGAINSLYPATETETERAARIEYEGIVAGLSDTCGLDLDRMGRIVNAIHETVICLQRAG